ncbi:MAG: hypothetical protein DWQ45_26185 [Planctomycetota bacterium]|nr:MAG: hypothetical protein DWQ29_02380 [Planctomycetota bacterium]REK20002.1 MAG: hypothetical protein DWQ41_27165 [Planctomycetota bacterium]REK27569.1 MAG: hypothetical protein DWQ45_26185 [Planctomycetota bacterium]
MLRFLASTCGVLMEVSVFSIGDPTPAAMSVAAIGLVLSVTVWSNELRRLADRLVGLDLRSADVSESHPKTD